MIDLARERQRKMSRYRKRPVEVEAYQMIFETMRFEEEWPEWLMEARGLRTGEPGSLYWTEGVMFVGALEGNMEVSPGDWIIRGTDGELYPCRPEIFAAVYDAVEEGAPAAEEGGKSYG
jgi:hypothetical protein